MGKVKKVSVLMIVCIMIVTLFAACSNSDDKKGAEKESTETKSGSEQSGTTEQVEEEKPAEPQKPEVSTEPVTLTFMAPWSVEQVEGRFAKALKEKYPHITIKPYAGTWVNAEELDKLFAKGEVPDLMLMTEDYSLLLEKDLLFPLDDMMKTFGFNTDKLRPGTVEMIRARDPEGQGRIIGIPVEDNVVALHYNKEIFDKFGVPYPHDGMNWDEVVDLAKKVTGERDGVKYRGMALNTLSQAYSQLSVSGTDPQTGEPQFSKDPAFAKFLELGKRIASIPGNYEKDIAYDFTKKDVAMSLGLVANTIPHWPEDLKYDIVTFPTWPDLPDVGPNSLPLTIAISKQSKYKEQAFQVLEFLMSEEQQTKMTRSEVPSVLNDPKILLQFAADPIERKKQKINIESLYKLKQAPPAPYSKYGPEALLYGGSPTNMFLPGKLREFIDSGEDTQSFLRKLDDEYAALVKEMKSKQ